MRFAHFFVDRPIFASVTSIVFLILGYVAYLSLPVAQYPEIVPPTVTVRASFPGANAETVAATIATCALFQAHSEKRSGSTTCRRRSRCSAPRRPSSRP